MVLPFFVRNILSGGESSPEGGLDKFWSKEVKLTKKDREGENMKK